MKNKTRLKQIEIGGGEARYWNAFLRTGVQCGDWQVSVERVSLIADILKIAGIVILCMEINTMLWLNTVNEVNEKLPYAFRCTKKNFYNIIININFCGGHFFNLTGLLNFCQNVEAKY